MSSPAKAHEPTMEEILASIRRIIADEDPQAGAESVERAADGDAAASGQWAGGQTGEDPDDVLELTDPVEPASHATGERDRAFPERPEAPSASPRPAASPRRPAAWPNEERLLSATADSVVSSAFGALAHTIVAENSRTLEDLVHEMLRPMLKSWLDENLPSLVERLVRQEIEHVSRGRR